MDKLNNLVQLKKTPLSVQLPQISLQSDTGKMLSPVSSNNFSTDPRSRFKTPPGIDSFSSQNGKPKTGTTSSYDGNRNFQRSGPEIGTNLPSVNNFLTSLHHSARDSMVHLPQNYFPMQQNVNWTSNQQISNYLFLRKVFNSGNTVQEVDPYSTNDLSFKHIPNPPEKLPPPNLWQSRNNSANYLGGFLNFPGQQNSNLSQIRSLRPPHIFNPYQMLGNEIKGSQPLNVVPKETKLSVNPQSDFSQGKNFHPGSKKLDTGSSEEIMNQIKRDELSISGLMDFEIEPSAQDLLKIELPSSPSQASEPLISVGEVSGSAGTNNSEDKLFSCNECGKCFNAHYNLTRHMPVHTGKILQPQSFSTNADNF